MEYLSDNPIEACAVCHYEYIPAKSKRVKGCPNCEQKERTGESIFEEKRRKQREQHDKWMKRAQERRKANPPPLRSKIAAMSQKGKIRAREVSEMKRELKEDAAEGAYVQCKGCEKWFNGIDASHKVPLSQSLALAAAPRNITLLCRDCHDKWENGTVPKMIELKNFVDDMHYLFDMDPERFWKIFYRCLDEFEKTGDKKLESIIIQMEAFDSEQTEL